ncbi:7372_t:CDS:2 [Dentiscutata erythropus]|uniref:7372_t:CDS:1 n=1 Tax=Dentiscutata erythropus TaxID=1348616 RepID=A0A9N9GRL8_9GLOM|nr:7372_t:CDS:2 [Dentiscutata erythropus]
MKKGNVRKEVSEKRRIVFEMSSVRKWKGGIEKNNTREDVILEKVWFQEKMCLERVMWDKDSVRKELLSDK